MNRCKPYVQSQTKNTRLTVSVLDSRPNFVRAAEQRYDLLTDLFDLSLKFRIRRLFCNGPQSSVGVKVGPALCPLYRWASRSAWPIYSPYIQSPTRRNKLTVLSILVPPHHVGTSNPYCITGLSLFMLCACISANLPRSGDQLLGQNAAVVASQLPAYLRPRAC